MPLTIVNLITDLNTGGAEQMLYKLVTRMDRQKFRPVVVSMTDVGHVGLKMRTEGIPVFSLGMALGRPSLKGILRFCLLLRRESPDILQTWLYHADLLGLITGRIARAKRIVWGLRCSDMDLRNYRFLTALTVRSCALLSALPDAIIANSRQGIEIHRKMGYHMRRMALIPNGFDTEHFAPDQSARAWLLGQLGLSQDAILIGLIARFDPMKDQKGFLAAASRLAAKHSSVHFLLVGKGMDSDNPELKPLLDHPWKDNILMLGPRDDIPRLTAALDIATSSSAYGEGFSNAIGEAMASGVPCVVTNIGDSAQIVGTTGIVVPPRDPDALVNAWERLLIMGRDGRKAMGDKARSRIMKHYKIEKVARRFEEFYGSLLALG